VHINIQPSELPETTIARSPSQEKTVSVLPILPGSPYRPTLTSSFSTFSQSGVSETPSQFSAQVDPAIAITSFDSQDPALQPIFEDFSCQEDVVPRTGASEGLENPENITDGEDYDTLLQDLLVVDTTTVDAVTPVWETLRAEDESFRSYAARRARSFGYPNLREQQLEALEKLVECKTDVMLIAKTSFGKSLIFQLAPLLMPDSEEPGIALILMPLTLLQQNQADNVTKRGGHLGAKCIVLDQDSNNSRNRRLIAEGKYTHSKLILIYLTGVLRVMAGHNTQNTAESNKD
jgi:ATP-dependent helicase YprA (DUF1998 family)